MRSTRVHNPLTPALASALLLLALPAAAAAPARPALSPKVEEQVLAGKVVILSESPEGSQDEAFVTGVAEIEAPPEAIWPILLSLDHIRASSSAVKEVISYGDTTVGADHRVLHLQFTLKVGFSEIRYHVRRDIHQAAGYLVWKLDHSKENDIADTSGSYSIHPGSRPGTSLFVYRANIKTGKAIPEWLEEELTQSSLKKYLGYVQRTAAGS